MNSNKNNLVLTTLQKANISNLKEEEIIKLANSIANNININGLRRHINSTLIVVIEDKTTDNNQKLELIKKLLYNQKEIERNVRNLKRKTAIVMEKQDIKNFLVITTEILTIIQQHKTNSAIKTKSQTNQVIKNNNVTKKEVKTITKKTIENKQKAK